MLFFFMKKRGTNDLFPETQMWTLLLLRTSAIIAIAPIDTEEDTKVKGNECHFDRGNRRGTGFNLEPMGDCLACCDTHVCAGYDHR